MEDGSGRMGDGTHGRRGREIGEGGWEMEDGRWEGEEVSDVGYMEAMSHGFEDFILDYPITIEIAIKKLKTRRSGGADGLLAEHLKHGGPVLTLWLKRIFNTIIHLEQIPSSFKLGMIVPVHKGKGHDPLICNNYRGITLTAKNGWLF